jgi:F-type H+-transporting ATPase subunit a
MEHGFTIGHLLFPHEHGQEALAAEGFQLIPIFHSGIAILILIGLILAARRNMALSSGDVLPSQRMTVQNFFEMIIGWMAGFMKEIIGPTWQTYVPLVISLWVYILINNFLGLVPYFEPPTSNYNTTVGLATVVFFATHYYGVKAHGISYLKHFIGPALHMPWYLKYSPVTLIVLAIELIGHFARIISLSIRLVANMFADHTVIAIFLALLAPLIPSIFMGIGIIVCILQAFIFSILAIIYIALAVHEE